MPTYFAYGLTIHSTLQLPELVDSDADVAAVAIREGTLDRDVPETNSNGFFGKVEGHSTFMYWESLGGFLVTDGKEITVDKHPDVEERLMRLPLLGPVMSVLLQQRGLLTLHASAVAIEGNVVAFLGPKGYGKSTTASVLHHRGHPLVTDDVLAIDLSRPHEARVAPGYPQFKLWPEAAEATFGEAASRFPVLHNRVEKQACRADEGFAASMLPLRRIYLLDFGAALTTKPLTGQAAFFALLRNTYDRHFENDPDASARHLKQCSQLAKEVEIHRLVRERSLEALDDMAEFIEREVLGDPQHVAPTAPA